MCNKSEHNHIHNHPQFNIFGKNTELYFAILSGIFLILGYALSFTSKIDDYLVIIYLISFFFGSFFAIQEAFLKLLKARFEIDLLMVVAAFGAAYLDKWAEGALLLFLFSLGHALEHYALGKAEKAISELGKLMPDVALVRKGNEFVEVPTSELVVGDTVLVKAHEQIAADGVVIAGESSVNQASITGESMPVDKSEMKGESKISFNDIPAEHRVFAGTINGESPLEIKVMRLASQSTVSRMIEMVSEAKAKQSPTQHLTKKIEKYYVPAVLLLVIILGFVFLTGIETLEDSLYRALTVLVASSPCALAISTPGTILSGIARGAKKGVVFKGGAALEDLGSVKAIAFDKTGTLTEGKPQVVDFVLNTITKEDFFALAMSIESFSSHPLAQSIISYSEQFTGPIEIDKNDVEVVNGSGIEAIVNDKRIQIGRISYLIAKVPLEIQKKINVFEEKGYTLVGMGSDSQFLGVIALQDKPKHTAKKMIKRLRKLGIKKIVMLTGDQQAVANTVGKELNISEVFGGLYPEDKVKAIEDLNKRYGKSAMIGDGVNDAPAMATSTVSVAMGAAGSDVALETADIALLSDKISKIPFAVGLSRSAEKIIKQNLYISLGSIAVLIPMALFDITGIGATIVLHEGTTVFVILNALRLLSYNLKEE
ncbi:Cd2+/Zn2+-exporting ATPase [Balneicella halophila]|uniref:P-type Zn(2+) transporter n=1 Tax=Balneicella halophila TaxID=1537566 RepID=A0A7L4UQJ2_BALHA|nr:heavy metal translocating P-type ATPase [Balneicella halophila]PVX52048.1 Cd2+/Zn2+-exporting ATPase [Balneicella halophila]